MDPVMTPRRGQTRAAELAATAAPARLTTTLYDVMATLQTVVESDEDDLVVAVVMHWLLAGCITTDGDVTMAAIDHRASMAQANGGPRGRFPSRRGTLAPHPPWNTACEFLDGAG